MTDSEIVALYWQRSEEAISRTMEAYGRYLFRLSANILHIREDAEECVSETCLTAWNQMPTDRPARLLPYLGRISRCLSLNRLDYLTARKRSADFTLQLSELAECLPAPDSTEQTLEGRELGAAISAFLRTQSEEDRIVFVRRYWYSEPIRRIARSRGTRESEVKSRLFRVRQRLKKYLEKEGFSL